MVVKQQTMVIKATNNGGTMGIPKPFKSLGLPTRVYITTVVKYLLMKLPTYN